MSRDMGTGGLSVSSRPIDLDDESQVLGALIGAPIVSLYFYILSWFICLSIIFLIKYSPILFFTLVVLSFICSRMGVCMIKVFAYAVNIAMVLVLIRAMVYSAEIFITVAAITTIIVVAYKIQPRKYSISELFKMGCEHTLNELTGNNLYKFFCRRK